MKKEPSLGVDSPRDPNSVRDSEREEFIEFISLRTLREADRISWRVAEEIEHFLISRISNGASKSIVEEKMLEEEEVNERSKRGVWKRMRRKAKRTYINLFQRGDYGTRLVRSILGYKATH